MLGAYYLELVRGNVFSSASYPWPHLLLGLFRLGGESCGERRRVSYFDDAEKEGPVTSLLYHL